MQKILVLSLLTVWGCGLHAQETPAASAPAAASRPAISGKDAVAVITGNFRLNPMSLVPASGKPLPETGSWGFRPKVMGMASPAACDLAGATCVQVLYRVPEANVACAWVLLAPSPASAELQIAALNEDAARYMVLQNAHRAKAADLNPPTPTFRAPLKYPGLADANHVNGSVVVKVTVGRDGLVQKADVVAGTQVFFKSAEESARQWKFAPGTLGGQPLTSQTTLVFTYASNGQASAAVPTGRDATQLSTEERPNYDPLTRTAGGHVVIVNTDGTPYLPNGISNTPVPVPRMPQ